MSAQGMAYVGNIFRSKRCLYEINDVKGEVSEFYGLETFVFRSPWERSRVPA